MEKVVAGIEPRSPVGNHKCGLYCVTTTQHVSVCVSLCLGDDKEWEQQCCWQTELVAGLDRVNVCVEKLQQDQERWTAQRGEQTPSIHVMVRSSIVQSDYANI